MVNKLHKRSKQFCPHCNKITMHTPKLGLVLMGLRLCETCRKPNKIMDIVQSNYANK